MRREDEEGGWVYDGGRAGGMRKGVPGGSMMGA